MKKALFFAILMMGLLTACNRGQRHYNQLDDSLNGSWKLDKLTLEDGTVHENIGIMVYNSCEPTEDDNTCTGTFQYTNSSAVLNMSFKLNAFWRVDKVFPDIDVADSANDSLSLFGQGYFIEFDGNKMTWERETDPALPRYEFTRQ
jgi:hypothetical protein